MLIIIFKKKTATWLWNLSINYTERNLKTSWKWWRNHECEKTGSVYFTTMHTEYQLNARYLGPRLFHRYCLIIHLHTLYKVILFRWGNTKMIKWLSMTHQGSQEAGIQTHWVGGQNLKSFLVQQLFGWHVHLFCEKQKTNKQTNWFWLYEYYPLPLLLCILAIVAGCLYVENWLHSDISTRLSKESQIPMDYKQSLSTL